MSAITSSTSSSVSILRAPKPGRPGNTKVIVDAPLLEQTTSRPSNAEIRLVERVSA
jgi:hypothetical protein